MDIELTKLKRFLKELDSARGQGTSMISLILAPGEQLSKAAQMLGNEQSTAKNIKSRVNRLSVLGALTSVMEKLKNYSCVPECGLVIYSGTYILPTGKEKKVTYDVVPPKPINMTKYLCDNKFHTEVLHDLFKSTDVWGFVILTGTGCLFGTLEGNNSNVEYEFDVDLPKKHGRGGQSKQRFERQGQEARANYVRKCCECATRIFIQNDKPIIKGLVLAGMASFKNKMNDSPLLDYRLKPLVRGVIDTAYGSLNGFNEAILASADIICDNLLIKERHLISDFMDNIARDTGLVVFGKNTLMALSDGVLKDLIVWENYSDIDEIIDANHKNVNIHIITDKSPESVQFISTFNGIGGILRYRCEYEYLEEECEEEIDEDFM